MTKSDAMTDDMKAHLETYKGFIKGSVALCLMCAFILVSLVNFKYGNSLIFLVGFGGLIAGLLAIIVDARASQPKWLLSIGVLVVYAIVVIMNVT